MHRYPIYRKIEFGESNNMNMPIEEESLLMRCVQCGELYPGSPTNAGELIPDGPAAGGQCHECGGDEFERITLSSD